MEVDKEAVGVDSAEGAAAVSADAAEAAPEAAAEAAAETQTAKETEAETNDQPVEEQVENQPDPAENATAAVSESDPQTAAEASAPTQPEKEDEPAESTATQPEEATDAEIATTEGDGSTGAAPEVPAEVVDDTPMDVAEDTAPQENVADDAMDTAMDATAASTDKEVSGSEAVADAPEESTGLATDALTAPIEDPADAVVESTDAVVESTDAVVESTDAVVESTDAVVEDRSASAAPAAAADAIETEYLTVSSQESVIALDTEGEQMDTQSLCSISNTTLASTADKNNAAAIADAASTIAAPAQVAPPPEPVVKDNFNGVTVVPKELRSGCKVATVRSVALKGFPEDYTVDDVEDFCATYGIVTKVVAGRFERDVSDGKPVYASTAAAAAAAALAKEKSESKDKEEDADKSEAEESPPPPPPLIPGVFAVEFASHLDAREFFFHAPTFAGLGIVAEALWDDLSRFAREMALDYGIMQRLESFFYRHRKEAPRNAKTRKMEPKQIYVHGDYKKVGFQTIIDHMKKFGRVLRMQELTGLYEGLVITFESQTAVKTLTQDIVEHMIGKLKFKTRPFFMTKTIALDPPVDADCVWVQGQSYAVPNFVEMSEDWMIRRDPKVAGQKRKEMALVTIDGVDPGEKVDENLEKEMSAFTLIHVFPVHGAFPVIPSHEYKHRVWEGKSVAVTGAPKTVNWRAFQQYFGDFGIVEYVNLIQPPVHGTVPGDADERPVAVVTFKQTSSVSNVLKTEYHQIDGRRLRVRQHTRCPLRVLAVISATPGAEGLPQAWKTSEDIDHVRKYFEMFGDVDFMMYRRTGIKENEPVILFQMSTFDLVEEILYFTHYINNKAVVVKQVRRVPAEGPIHLVDDSLQVSETDASKVKMTCRIDGKRFPPPSELWWSKEFSHLLAQRKAARDAKVGPGSSKASSEEPEAKKRKPNEDGTVATAQPASTPTAASISAAAKPATPAAKSAAVPAKPAVPAAKPTVAATPPPSIPMVRERFVNQVRDVTNVDADNIAYLHIYATKSKETKTREKFSAVEARSFFESFGKIKAFWSKKQVMSYAEFAYFDPKVAKKVCLDPNLTIVSLPPANTKLFFTVFPIYRNEVDHVPWPIGLHKTKDDWLHLKMAEEEKKEEKQATGPEYVTIDSDEEPMPPGDIPMPAEPKATPPPAVAPLTKAKDPVKGSKESTPVRGEPAAALAKKKPVTRESTPVQTAASAAAAMASINAFGDRRDDEEEPSEPVEEDDKKSRAKALLAAALKKRQADGAAADDGSGGSGANSVNKAKRTVYVRGFMDDPSQSVKLDVFKFFKQFGKVENVTLGYSKEQGLQYTWAAVEMEDDAIIKDLIRSNLFMDGFPLHLSRKKDNWDTDAGASKLDSSQWRHAYVTGLSDGVSADEIQRFLDAKVGGVKRVDSRVVNSLSIFLVEFDSNATCLKALKGGSFSFLGDIFVWPPYVYEDLCVRKQSFEQQLTAIQGLNELPARKLIHQCLVVQKLETQLRSFFTDCTLRIAGDALARVLPSESLELYFEFTPSDTETARDAKAPKVSLDDVREGNVTPTELGMLPAHSRLQLLSAALEEIGVAESFRVTAPTAKRRGSLNFRHTASDLSCSIGVAKTAEMERTALLQLMQQHDSRFAPLFFAFRHFIHVWSRIDSRVASFPQAERLPADVVILIMTMVYLQQVQPPVLPSIRELQALTEETNVVEGWNCVGGLVPPSDIPRPETNDSSLLTLLSGMFRFYANFDYDNFVISPYYGKSVPFSLLFLPQVPGHDDLFKIGTKMNVQDIFALNRNLTLEMKTAVRESIANGCTKGYAALSDPDIEDSSLFNQVVWGYPLALNEHVLKNARPIVDGQHPLDQHLVPLAQLEVSGLDTAPKKDLHVTEYIYMIKEDLPPTLLPVIKESSNRVWFHHICYLVHRALAYTLHVQCKVVESRYALTTDDAMKVAFSADATASASDADEAIEKVAEFWCFTPIKLRKNYATYWTSSGKNTPAIPSTHMELTVLQNLYREVHRKGHACYQPIYFNVVLEQMNTAQPAVKITMTGEHIHKPLLDFLKDYIPKLVNVQFGEVFN